MDQKLLVADVYYIVLHEAQPYYVLLISIGSFISQPLKYQPIAIGSLLSFLE